MPAPAWTDEEIAWLRANPEAPYGAFVEQHGHCHGANAYYARRRRAGIDDQLALLKPRQASHETGAETAPVSWDKAEGSLHWSDVLAPAIARQGMARAAKRSQDHGRIAVATTDPLPVLFISDWHIGSWGTSYLGIAEMTKAIQDLGLHVAVLGDMLQMSIKLRNVLEVSDNLLTPGEQMAFLRSWLQDMAPHVLWATWDNHSVMREEQAVGFSTYAELFKDKTIYHSGIGHIDLTVGEETYRVASSHRFRGNSIHNPTHGQGRYLRMEGIDREIAVAGDSHRPAMASYYDGPLQRFAINCGTLQTDSGYAKRFFSLSSHDSMPVLLFFPDRHKVVPFMNLDDYLAATGRAA